MLEFYILERLIFIIKYFKYITLEMYLNNWFKLINIKKCIYESIYIFIYIIINTTIDKYK